jgi:hypothetical protein
MKSMAIKSIALNIKDDSIYYLIELFKADIQKLSGLLDKDLSFWMIPDNIRRK